MPEQILIGRGQEIAPHSFEVLRRHLEAAVRTPSPRLSFMTLEHHRVRDAAVAGLPKAGAPLSAAQLARATGIPFERIGALLDELEARLFFLVRDSERRVSWAFPVTSERTPHVLELSTGETTFAA